MHSISALHYLTQDLTHRSHPEQVRIACEAGVKWIQLRVKNQTYVDWQKIAEEVKQITEHHKATLIINDHVMIAKEVDAEGVHLGHEDDSWDHAREILGDKKIIGFSAHSIEELLLAKDFDVDYFGLGPFRFTATKEKLQPVLGTNRMKEIIQQARRAGIRKPIIAIGGIQLNDVHEILEADADGIAVSSAINLSDDPADAARKFMMQVFREPFQITN